MPKEQGPNSLKGTKSEKRAHAMWTKRSVKHYNWFEYCSHLTNSTTSNGHPAAQKWFEGEKKAVGRHWRRRRSEFSFSLSLDAPEAGPPSLGSGGPQPQWEEFGEWQNQKEILDTELRVRLRVQHVVSGILNTVNKYNSNNFTEMDKIMFHYYKMPK